MPQVLRKGSKNLNIENWKVFSQEGKHMFTCGESKAHWYLNRNLAKPYGKKEIILTFRPKGYGYSNKEVFGLAGREIKCVVSGNEDNLQRHHIVPYCYRKWFPEEYKTKNHHDVVLVTYKIHEEYEKHATNEKNIIAKEFGVKTMNEFNLEYTKILCEFSGNKTKMLSRLHSIFKNYNNIPYNSIIEIFNSVEENSCFKTEFLKTLNIIQLLKVYRYLRDKHDKEFEYYKQSYRNTYDHGYHVVQHLDSHKKIQNFVVRWRKHFVETMNPQYMPKGWDVDYRVKVTI